MSADTPLFSAIKKLIDSNSSRLYMPGHKGSLPSPLAACAHFDITELDDLESLYSGQGAIARTESLYTSLYGTLASVLSAGGSTLCIQAMLFAALKPGDTIIAARGVHTSAVSAMALIGVNPYWVFPKTDPATSLCKPLDAADIRFALKNCPQARAVYITSPDYFGQLTDIKAVSAVCRQFNVLLLVDNAHGAHLKFLPQDLHPCSLGADICCDSLHKTLPALTGAAVLHTQNQELAAVFKQSMAVFGSTSPSFLTLLSADLLITYLQNHFREDLSLLCQRVGLLKRTASEHGLLVIDNCCDPIRLSLCFGLAGYNRTEFEKHLNKHRITAEYISNAFCVLLFSPNNTDEDFNRVHNMLCDISPKTQTAHVYAGYEEPQVALSVREAVFSKTITVPVEEACGRIAGAVVSPCPPGIPVIVPGEKFGSSMVSHLKNSGILFVNVLQ